MLDLLPISSMDSSIITPVLIGVVLVWLFQETLGWGLSGLVVPGYLASILVIQPEAGALVFVEAVLTYFIVRAVSDGGPRWLPWSPFFGRERFFHIVMVATGVRLALEADGGLLDFLAATTGWADLGDLNAAGLVLVPLLANTLWRSGLARGVPRVGIPIVLTWAVLELVLLPYTNVSLSSFELTFEDLALDFEGSAKAHLLVLVGAALAAAANLHWGWDMGGIIVPGLLTLIWLDPTKLTVTVIESTAVALLLTAVVRLPGIRRWNLAGGRILMLGFTIDYILRTVVAWTPWQETGVVLSALELQGFGYLLPTLMAVRMHQHREVLRVVLPVAGTSLAGFALGSILGLGMLMGIGNRMEEEAVWLPSHDLPAGLPRLVDLAHRGGSVSPMSAGSWAVDHPGETVGFAGGPGAMHARYQYRTNAVVVANLGEPAVAQAAWILATIGETRGVVLCGARSENCVPILRSLRAQGTAIWQVEAAERPSRLRFSETLASSITLRELADAFGEVGIEAEAPTRALWADESADLVLQLNLAARLRSAAMLFGAEHTDWETLLQKRLSDIVEEQASIEQVRFALTELVLDPWMVWYDSGSADALTAASRGAHHLGLQLASAGSQSLLSGGFWRVFLDRSGTPRVFHVPNEGLEPGAASLADTLARSEQASAVVVDLLPEHPIGPSPERRPAQLALARVVEHIARRHGSLGTVTVRGMRDVADAGSGAVLHTGHVRRRDEALPAVADVLAARLVQVGEAPRLYDGSAALLSVTDAGNRGRLLTAAATGAEDHASLHASTRLRDRFTSVLAPGHPLQRIVEESEIPRVDLPLDQLVASVEAGEPILPAALLEAHQQLTGVGRAVDLATTRWQARRKGWSTELMCTPELGCRWLRSGACKKTGCTGVLLPLQHGAPIGANTSAQERILFDSAAIPVAWGEAP